jgi:hypothetical protein
MSSLDCDDKVMRRTYLAVKTFSSSVLRRWDRWPLSRFGAHHSTRFHPFQPTFGARGLGLSSQGWYSLASREWLLGLPVKSPGPLSLLFEA